MGRIVSNTGLITGTDISGTVDKLISLSAVPRDRMVAKVQSLKAEQVVVNELTALVVGVQLQTTRLGAAANLSSVNVSSSNADVLKATAGSNTVEGTYQVKTIATAQASSQISSTFESSTATLTAGDLVVRTGGFVDNSAKLETLRGGAGIERGKIQITNRSGESRTVDLRNAVTISDVADAINKTADLKINAKISGDKLVLSDYTGQTTSNIIVSEVDGGRTAADLGFDGANVAANEVSGGKLSFLSNTSTLGDLRDGRGLEFSKGKDMTVSLADGSSVEINLDDTTPPSRVGQLLDKINEAANGKFEARIASDGVSIELLDKTSGGGTISVTGKLADSLGLSAATASSGVVKSTRLQSTLTGSLLGTLNGGNGVGELGTIEITNRSGAINSVDLSQAQSLDQVIDLINQSASGVTASYNRARTGIRIVDNTGSSVSNLKIANGGSSQTATKLGIAADTSATAVEGTSLNAQFVSRATKLTSLNQGAGVNLGGFTITNSDGQIGAINLAVTGAKTVGDVIDAVNNLNINVEARLNEAGDGFVLIDNSSGAGKMVVAESGSGSTAKDLKIVGTAKDTTINGQTKSAIESNQNYKISVASTDTVESLVNKIKADGSSPIQASLLNTGNGAVRIVFSSKKTGVAGRVQVEGDSVGIATNQSAQARDAVISVGAGDQFAGTVVTSSTNNFSNILPGVELTVSGVTSDPITVTASKSSSKTETNLKLFVDQYNKVVEKLAKETAYDENTKTSGYLFGSSAALRVEQTLSRFITTRTSNSGSIKTLAQLGVNVGEDGKLSLDSTKLNAAIASDPQSVETFFTQKDNGFADRGKALLENLVGVKGSVLMNRNETIQRRVDDLNDRVDSFNIKLDRERTKLTKQFVGMETVIAKIQSNLDGLNLSSFNMNPNQQ